MAERGLERFRTHCRAASETGATSGLCTAKSQIWDRIILRQEEEAIGLPLVLDTTASGKLYNCTIQVRPDLG